MSNEPNFEAIKEQTLKDIINADKSPKGSIDEPIQDFVVGFNDIPQYVTTSSCSGRISVFGKPPMHQGKGAGKWLYVEHGYTTPEAILEKLEGQTEYSEVLLKVELFILHVRAKTLDDAQALLQTAIHCGFRESGITLGQKGKKIMVAVRTTAGSLETPLMIDGKLTVSKDALGSLIADANNRLEANFKKIERFAHVLSHTFQAPISNPPKSLAKFLPSTISQINGKKAASKALNPTDTQNGEKDHPVVSLSEVASLIRHTSSMKKKAVTGNLRSLGRDNSLLSRWGHNAAELLIDGEEHVVMFGGYGGPGTHRRLNDVIVSTKGLQSWQVAKPEGAAPSPRLRGASAALNDSTLLLAGGRESPFAPLSDVWTLSCNKTAAGYSSTWSEVPVAGASFPPRWGLSLVAYPSSPDETVCVVFGGRNSEECLGDTQLIKMKREGSGYTCSVEPAKHSGPSPSPRYGHTASLLGEYMLVYGGYTSIKHDGSESDSEGEGESKKVFTPRNLDEAPLHSDEVFLFHIPTAKWKAVKSLGTVPPPIASHSICVLKQGEVFHLVLVGGASPRLHELGIYLTKIHAKNLGLAHLELTWHALVTPVSYSQDPDRAMLLHKHTATIVSSHGDEHEESKGNQKTNRKGSVDIALLGGGGLCFSFGHHFSQPSILSLPLQRVLNPETVGRKKAAAAKGWDRQALEWLSQKAEGLDAVSTFRDAWLRDMGPSALEEAPRGYLVCLPPHVRAVKVWLERHKWLLKDEKVTKGCLDSLDLGANEAKSDDLVQFVDGWQLELGEPTETSQLAVMLIPAKQEALVRLFTPGNALSEVEEAIKDNVAMSVSSKPAAAREKPTLASTLKSQVLPLLEQHSLPTSLLATLPKQFEWVGSVVLITIPHSLGSVGQSSAHAVHHQHREENWETSSANDPEDWRSDDPENWGEGRVVAFQGDDPEGWEFEDPEVWGEYHLRRAPRPKPKHDANPEDAVEPGMDRRWGALAAPGGDLWRVYAEVLKASAVGRRQEIDAGGKRESRVRLLWGSSGWTEVRQHGIRYQFDVTKLMFSAGNVNERGRMGRVSAKGEVVVDLFAGMGYFTVPLLVYAGAAHVHAFDWNTNAVEALQQNLRINKVQDRCTVHEGDNSKAARIVPSTADRVLLGLIPSSERAWPTAVSVLKSTGGTVHVHGNVAVKDIDSWAVYVAQTFEKLAKQKGKLLSADIAHIERVKSYAPRVEHIVVDLKLRPEVEEEEKLERFPHDDVQLDCLSPGFEYCQPILLPPIGLLSEGVEAVWSQHGRVPAVVRGYYDKPSLAAFTPSELPKRHADTTVSVHAADSPILQFVNKNFTFTTLPFKEFVEKAYAYRPSLGVVYLRGVGKNPRKDRAHFWKDFPELASALPFPKQFVDEDNEFSSVFRVSSAGMQLWTHYDVMDNVLLQLYGKKRVLLFPPSASEFLALSGSSSPIVHVDNKSTHVPEAMRKSIADTNNRLYPEYAKALSMAQEVVLQPGDALLIPALWSHSIITPTFSVGVNVFWRDPRLSAEDYFAKDLYGNRDPKIAEEALDSVRSSLASLGTLPESYRSFYKGVMNSMLKK